MKKMITNIHRSTVTHHLPGALLLSALLASQLGTRASAQGSAVRYDAQPGGSKVKIEGTSSIHDWSMESPVIGGFMETDAGFPESALKGGDAAKPKVEVFIPVRTLKSYNKRMDEVYQEHMEEPKFKKMEYKLTELKAKGSAPKDGKCEFDAIGTLTVHGVAKPITMAVTIEKAEAKKLKVAGTTAIKMSDFGVKPPNPDIGVAKITTGDDLKVSFEWTPGQK
jgi:polyisoprenoid-binding protein YceI